MTIQAPADAWGNVPVRTTVRASDAGGADVTAHVEITPTANGPVTDPDQVWPIPHALLGGLDVALTGLGAKPIPQYDPNQEAQLYDGLTPAGGGFGTSFSSLPVTLTVQLAGQGPLPIAGIMLDPQAWNGFLSASPKDFTFLTSVDGVTYTPALTGVLSPLPVEQSFVLPAPVTAHFAQLQITSVYGPAATFVTLGEFKVIATPGTVVSDSPLDIADPGVGGHVAWMDPQPTDFGFLDRMLTADGLEQTLVLTHGGQLQWAVGFQDDREAEINRLEWIDPPGTIKTSQIRSVAVAVSTDGPLGPWTDMGTWQLKRAANGSVTPFTFDQPTWARFVRFTSNSFKGYSYPEVPDQLRVIEQATDDQYRSVVAEWGDANQNGIHEALDPPALTVPQTSPDGNDTQATATPLAAGTPVQDTAHAGEDVDWYSVQVPGTQNTLDFTVGGTPFVGVSLALFDANGGQVPMTYLPGDAGTAQYRATVTPGASYAVEVTQPPFSAALTYDTSGSMGPYLGFVQEALTSFAGGVVKGRERVTMIPFEEQPLIQGWSDDPYVLADAVEGQVLGSSSSSAETSLINATDELSTQEGAKAILIVTDAETSSFDQMTALWRKLTAVRPVIFAVHVAGNGSPATDQHFMQDWAASTDGFYQYAQTHAEIDRAFDRMATWLARPAGYTLSYGASFVKPPSGGGPARLAGRGRSTVDEREPNGARRRRGRGGGDPRHVGQHAHADQRQDPAHRCRQERARRPAQGRPAAGRSRGAAHPRQRRTTVRHRSGRAARSARPAPNGPPGRRHQRGAGGGHAHRRRDRCRARRPAVRDGHQDAHPDHRQPGGVAQPRLVRQGSAGRYPRAGEARDRCQREHRWPRDIRPEGSPEPCPPGERGPWRLLFGQRHRRAGGGRCPGAAGAVPGVRCVRQARGQRSRRRTAGAHQARHLSRRGPDRPRRSTSTR